MSDSAAPKVEQWMRDYNEIIDRLTDFVRSVNEWVAKFPLKGDGSVEDNAVATELYCCCEGAEDNLYELRQLIASHCPQSAAPKPIYEYKIPSAESGSITVSTQPGKGAESQQACNLQSTSGVSAPEISHGPQSAEGREPK